MAEEGLDVQGCVRRVRLGDEEAARELLNHLYPLVIKLVRAHLPRRTAEEDMAQTVFMKIFVKLEQFSGTVPLEHWVSRIAVNTCYNQLERERVRPELRWADLTEEEEQALQAVATATSQREPGDGLASRELVQKLLALLPARDRLLVNLLHLEGKSVEEVRQITGWGVSVIKVRAFRARRKMKSHLKSLLRQEAVL